MLVVMKQNATPDQIESVVETIREMGYSARPIPGRVDPAVVADEPDGRA